MGTTFRAGLTSVQFLSTEVVRVVAVVGEAACDVVEEATEGTGVVRGHGPWKGSISHSLLQSA